MRSGTSTAGAVVGGALLLLAARRILIAAAALAPPRPLARSADLPGVVLLVPARNEEASLARLLPALDRLDYPAPLAVVVVNDGSTDGTAGALASWSVERPTATVVTQRSRAGKARALNAGLAAAPPAEIVVVCDADLVPAPGSIRAFMTRSTASAST